MNCYQHGLIASLWDSSALLSTSSVVGNLAGSFFAYRDQPTLLNVIVFVVFWGAGCVYF
ncbi:hypothetical protein [Oligella urethralis]|uniref:hypothetical protein n=1 Tax=Oligella urethralis TaxID=90245 RepID=UPI001C694301|nr:hypothetical protein [Oligella urethralis]